MVAPDCGKPLFEGIVTQAFQGSICGFESTSIAGTNNDAMKSAINVCQFTFIYFAFIDDGNEQ